MSKQHQINRRQWDGRQILALRRHLGLTQRELADRLGARQQTISEWENGMYKPRGASSTLLSIIAERAKFEYEAKKTLTSYTEPHIRNRKTMIKIEVYRGDLTQLEIDAMVNAANNHLWMGGGVAGALKRAGGKEIETEAVKKGPIPIGEAVATGAGKLKTKHVIHAAVMGQDLKTDAKKIRQATRNSLLRGDELKIKSIAFPALGTGVGGFPLDECARIMISEVLEYATGNTGIERVVFVLYDQPAYQAFKQELDKHLAERA